MMFPFSHLKWDSIKRLGSLEYGDNAFDTIKLGEDLVGGIFLLLTGSYYAGATAAGDVNELATARLFDRIEVVLGTEHTVDISGDALAVLQSTLNRRGAFIVEPVNTDGTTTTIYVLLWVPLCNKGDVVDLSTIQFKQLEVTFGDGLETMVPGHAADATLTNVQVSVYAAVRAAFASDVKVTPPTYIVESTLSIIAGANRVDERIPGAKYTKLLHILLRESGCLSTALGNLTTIAIRKTGGDLTGELADYLIRGANEYAFGLALHASHLVVPFSSLGQGIAWQNTHVKDLLDARLQYDSDAGLTSPTVSVVVESLTPVSRAIGPIYAYIDSSVQDQVTSNPDTSVDTTPVPTGGAGAPYTEQEVLAFHPGPGVTNADFAAAMARYQQEGPWQWSESIKPGTPRLLAGTINGKAMAIYPDLSIRYV